MALLEPVYWQSKEFPLGLKQAILAPELICSSGYPGSPIRNPSVSLPSPTSRISNDSGFNSPPPSPISPSHSIDLSSPLTPPCQYLIAAGGTGFSLGVIATDKGTMHQLSIPLPEQILESPPVDITAFTLADITTVTIVGESQLWAGTSIGSLHCFGLTPDLRLTNHVFINVNEPILSITSRPIEYIFPSILEPNVTLPPSMALTTEVLIGLPYGYIIVLVGESDAKGQLKKAVDKLSSRRIIRFTNSPVNCAVNSITHVVSEKDGECYWCGCGDSVYVLRSRDWKRIAQFPARVRAAKNRNNENQEVSQIVSCDVGVWSYLSGISSISLWDKSDFSLKLHLNYCNSQRSLHLRHETSCIHYLHPFLFIGTKQGDILVFKIIEKISIGEGQSHSASTIYRTYDYKFISSTHVTINPIINITTTTTMNINSHNVLSSLPHTPSSPVINILAIEGGENSNKSKIHIFELSLSLCSQSHCSSPLSDITIVSGSSLHNNSVTPKRLSIVGSSNNDYIPLKNN